MLSIEEAIDGRQSTRAFLPTAVPRATIERILELAARAPSGSNMQPWRVRVLTGPALAEFTAELYAKSVAGDDGRTEWDYYPKIWREPFHERRRATGWGLYSLLGIRKGDRAGTRRQQARNYLFFDAPVGLIVTLDRDLALGSWIDIGAFLQTLMLAARGFGLETCPQAAFRNFHEAIRERLDLHPQEIVVCGVALGHPDRSALINTYRTPRAAVSEFTTFIDRLPERRSRSEAAE